MKRILFATAFLALITPAPFALAEENVVAAKSTLTVSSKQMGVPVEATFDKFAAHIDFNAAKPETSKIAVDVDITSFNFDPSIDSAVLAKAWLNAADFPQAHFEATSVKALGGGKFEARGPLSIKGKSVDAVAPFTYKTDANGATYEGEIKIKRLQYNVGEGEWKDTDTVADDVAIKFKVVTAKKK